jgi:transcriptional regulator with XRE-family HTH domain
MTEIATATEADWFSDDTATFGDRLAGAREAAGLTQADLAQRLGVTLDSLQAWEDDLSEPRGNRVQMLAGLLNVSIAWLLTGKGEGVEAPSSDGAAVDLSPVLAELREMRGRLEAEVTRLGQIENRLLRGARHG